VSHHKGAYEENFKKNNFRRASQEHENVPKRYKYKNRSRQGIDFVVHVAYELLDFIKIMLRQVVDKRFRKTL